MKFRLYYFLSGTLFLLLFIADIQGQISQGGIPPSFIEQGITNNIEMEEISLADLSTIIKEVENNEKEGTLYKFAKMIPVDFSMNNSGTWTDFPSGARIWRLKIIAYGALALGIYYDQFWLPKESRLYLYSEDKEQVIGAFTDLNNSESGLFANELLKGDVVYLEYYEPKPLAESPVIRITEVAYAFRSVGYLYEKDTKGFGDSDACEVNINCSEGNNWQLQKRGAVRISVKEGSFLGWCSGSLVNNVRQDKTPYVLTADHCGGNASTSDLNQWVFNFNYEA
ncbi:protease, partial [Bacteroidota bacterium]